MVDKHLHPSIWKFLEEIPDPEIPIINLVELGVIRKIEGKEENLLVTITPTYTGCPAKQLFNDLIKEKLTEKGFSNFTIESTLYPAWTTDWLSDETKKKLMDDGISPPTEKNQVVTCPHCKSTDTKMVSRFGTTPCQSFHTCNSCSEPFNYFKCH